MLQRRFSNLKVPEDRGPLRVMFVHTELVVGGAETLLVEIIRNMDSERFTPELCCLKQLSELGEVMAQEVPTFTGLLENKYDWRVLGRLTQLLKDRHTDAVVTIGTGGDRMFWGRLAAWRANVPVILSALHSTGYPVCVERINRLLTPLTDGFIGCAKSHSEFLATGEGCPAERVFTVWNGVDINRFCIRDKVAMRRQLDLPLDAPVAGIVAALRSEKQHVQLVEAWSQVVQQIPNAILVIVGDGVERESIEAKTQALGIGNNVRMLGTRHDVHEVLAAFDVKVLASKMEANPASTLEAAACGLPVVVPNVGSLPDTVEQGKTGILYDPAQPGALANSLLEILSDRAKAQAMGAAGRELVCRRFSLEVMVRGYEQLVEGVYRAACEGGKLSNREFDRVMDVEMDKIVANRHVLVGS